MDLSRFSLEDKVALVTGGGRGIGRAIALGLADAGAKVVVAARTLSEIENTASAIQKKGSAALAVQADVREAAQVEKIIAATLNKFNRLDILVNNAGGGFVRPALDHTETTFDVIIRENLKSMFLCSQAAARLMIKQGKGTIISNSSMAGIKPAAGLAIYAASKAGIISLTKTLAAELAPHNIRVNCVAPGFIETHGIELMENGMPDIMKERLNEVPLGRFGRPEDVAGTVIFLASDASSYITGETIQISGGLFNMDLLKP